MSKIQNLIQNSSRQAKIIFFTLLFGFILIACISIFFLTRTNEETSSHIYIEDFSSYTSASDGYRRYSEELIWQVLQKLDNIPTEEISNAKIREDSFSEQTSDDIVVTSFLVDLESLHYTFRITFNWDQKAKQASKDPAISINCPTPEEIIYPDTKCPLEITLQLRNYLPHEEYLSDGTQINLTLQRYATYQNHANETYLDVSLPTCNNYEQLLEAKNITQKWLNSLALDSSNLRIEVSCSNCPLNQTQTNTDRCKVTNINSENSSLLSELPYADTNFKIEPADSSDKKIKIIIFIDRASSDYPNNIKDAESRYLNEALNWIKSRGFDPSTYPYETKTELL
jgi:hypothetical protein